MATGDLGREPPLPHSLNGGGDDMDTRRLGIGSMEVGWFMEFFSEKREQRGEAICKKIQNHPILSAGSIVDTCGLAICESQFNTKTA